MSLSSHLTVEHSLGGPPGLLHTRRIAPAHLERLAAELAASAFILLLPSCAAAGLAAHLLGAVIGGTALRSPRVLVEHCTELTKLLLVRRG